MTHYAPTAQSRQRATSIFEAHRNGKSVADIAAEYGVGRQRVYAILSEESRRRSRPADPFDGLPIRIVNACLSAGLHTPDAVALALVDGSLRRIPNLGAASIHEIANWVSVRGNKRLRVNVTQDVREALKRQASPVARISWLLEPSADGTSYDLTEVSEVLPNGTLRAIATLRRKVGAATTPQGSTPEGGT